MGRWSVEAPESRFWKKVNKDGPIPAHRRPDLGPCWIWIGAIARSTGYGRFSISRLKKICAHEFMTGPAPDGFERDHLCRNRACVKLSHIEFVTHRENVLRGMGPTALNSVKTICKYGHSLAGHNLYMPSDGSRQCKTCRRNRSTAFKQAMRLSDRKRMVN